MQITVRGATLVDLPTLKTILNDAVRYKVSKGDEAWGIESWTDKEVAQVIKLENTKLVSMADTIVGCVDLIWEDTYNWGTKLGSDSLAGYIHRLAILSEFKSKDLGAQIINWVSTQVASNGRRYIRLDCQSSNTSLCRYYEDQGFKLVSSKGLRSETTAYYQKPVK
jgi:ribosomal protein S18 acetylase RimI-like enzyme